MLLFVRELIRKVRELIRKHKKFLFWSTLVLLGAGVAVASVLDSMDARRNPVDCPNEGAKESAFLYLNQLDSATRKIKGRLMVTPFETEGGKVKFQAVTLRPDGETLIPAAIRPYPMKAPEKSGRADPAPSPNTAGATPTSSAEPTATASPTPSSSPTPAAAATPAVSATPTGPWYDVELPYNSLPFTYPFEDYLLDLRVDYERHEDRNGEKKLVKIPLKVQVRNYIDELVVGSCSNRFSFDTGEATPLAAGLQPTEFSLVLKRHRFVRVIAVILYGVAVIFLFYIARREETRDVLTNSLGYIAALWGIREIIVGYAKLFPTLVDFVTLALYVIVVAIVAHTWIFSSPTESLAAAVAGAADVSGAEKSPVVEAEKEEEAGTPPPPKES